MNKELLPAIKEDVYKCSKCGLCQCVCPLYQAVKNEMFIPRGRFIILNNFFNNNAPLSKKFVKDFDICLNCNVCKTFCPSDIDVYRINTVLKNALDYKYSFVNFSFIYKVILNLYGILSFLYKYLPFKSLFLNTYIDNIFDVKIKRGKTSPEKIKGNIVYFEGCFNKYINPSDKNASLNIIEKSGYRAEKIISNCCGYPYLQEGNFKKLNDNISDIKKQIPKNTSCIICSCDSCYDTLYRILDEPFKSKLLRFDDFLKLNSYNLPPNPAALYFKPLLRTGGVYLPQNTLPFYKKGICSLMENFFILKYKKTAVKIIETLFKSDSEIKNGMIFTSCLLSKWGLIKETAVIKSNKKVYSYAEYIELLSDTHNG